MKFKDFIKNLKPTKLIHFVGYGTIASIAIAGTIVGVVVANKSETTNNTHSENKNSPNTNKKPGNNTVQNSGSNTKGAVPKTGKQGKQRQAGEATTNAINMAELIKKLKEAGSLDAAKVGSILTELGVNVNLAGGTSYHHFVIGNKHGDIDRFIENWNKLSVDNKNALTLTTFSKLFGKVPESIFHIANQVHIILNDLKQKDVVKNGKKK